MVRVKSFKWNPNEDEAKVVYTIVRDDGDEKHQLECADAPTKELLDALQDLEEDALKECEVVNVGDRKFRQAVDRVLGEGYMEREHDAVLRQVGAPMDAFAVVRSVSYSWQLDIMGASICLLVKLDHSDSPLTLNTPHKPCEPYSGEAGHTLPERLADKLRRLHVLIERYIDGERVRKQTDLFDEEPGQVAA